MTKITFKVDAAFAKVMFAEGRRCLQEYSSLSQHEKESRYSPTFEDKGASLEGCSHSGNRWSLRWDGVITLEGGILGCLDSLGQALPYGHVPKEIEILEVSGSLDLDVYQDVLIAELSSDEDAKKCAWHRYAKAKERTWKAA